MKINIEELKAYIDAQSAETRVYFGADSERVMVNGKWMVDYLLVVVVHIDGRHGAKVFGEIQREFDYDKKLDRPKLRLMTEVAKIAELYCNVAEVVDLEARHVELHLDINALPVHGSNCAMAEAIGYIKGVCGIDPKVKPNSWAASIAADRLKTIK
jgi:hypothetical protein